MADTPLLDKISRIEDTRALTPDQLVALADEVRTEMIKIVSLTGGHLGAGLGVVELTVALHHVFDTPHDRLIWDVGHQAYPHKILTGRRERMTSLRQAGGLSGFTKRSESVFDPFGAGHSSTSISAALGMKVASDLKGESRHVIAVIGDGAMSAGMAFEAMNNAGIMDNRLIVILNDNDMSIDPPTGAVSAYLAQLTQGDRSSSVRLVLPFENLGVDYIGPVDGHDMQALLSTLKAARDHDKGPVLVHVKSQKGKGYAPAEKAADKYHGVSRFDVTTGAQIKNSNKAPSYTSVFAKSLIAEAKKDTRIVAITAAMPSGTGIGEFASIFPDRSFDVGIAEQHAVTFAAGLATEGLKPFCALYSTFLQRAYDQLVHDVAIQKLPVRFPIDRAGFVGADGATHAGAFDIAFLSNLPNMVVMAASDEAELMHMVATASHYENGPIAFRYPRGTGTGIDLPDEATPLLIGKGRIVKDVMGSKIAILSLGARLGESLKAAEQLDQCGLPTLVADARFAKPLDRDLLLRLVGEHEMLITIEEGASGGFGSQVFQLLSDAGALDGTCKIRSLVMDDRFTEQGSPEAMYAANGLDAQSIVKAAFDAFGQEWGDAFEQDEMT